MIKLYLGYIIGIIIICAVISSSADKKVDDEYSKGEKQGYEVGYSEVEAIYKQKIKEQTAGYERKLGTQKKTYEKKIDVANKDGFSTGKKDKQKSVEDNLQKTSSEKEKKGKWNDVLFNVND